MEARRGALRLLFIMGGMKGSLLALAFFSALLLYYSVSLSELNDQLIGRPHFMSSHYVSQRFFRHELFHVITTLKSANTDKGLDKTLRSIKDNLEHPLIESMHLIVEEGIDAVR